MPAYTRGSGGGRGGAGHSYIIFDWEKAAVSLEPKVGIEPSTFGSPVLCCPTEPPRNPSGAGK